MWGGVTTTRLDHTSVWTPDIYLQEDVSEEVATGPEKYMTQVRFKLCQITIQHLSHTVL